MSDRFSSRRLAATVGVVLGFFAVGTIGFRLIDDESWLDSLYRTVVTMSLTGIDTRPASTAGRILTILLVLTGVTIFGYVAAIFVEAMARGVIGDVWREKRRRREIEGLRDHTIICGYGRVGRRIAEEFRTVGAPFVVLDHNPDVLAVARDRGDLVVSGHGTEDEALARAGLERARALVVASDDDSANLYITLSARAARADLLIVARASDEEVEKKLRLAGASRVVLPYATAGRVMANLVIKPQVAAFANIVTTSARRDLRFEQIEIPREWAKSGHPIRELHVRSSTGATIIALQKPDGVFDTRPEGDTVLEAGDIIVGVGSADEIAALEQMFAPQETVAH